MVCNVVTLLASDCIELLEAVEIVYDFTCEFCHPAAPVIVLSASCRGVYAERHLLRGGLRLAKLFDIARDDV